MGTLQRVRAAPGTQPQKGITTRSQGSDSLHLRGDRPPFWNVTRLQPAQLLGPGRVWAWAPQDGKLQRTVSSSLSPCPFRGETALSIVWGRPGGVGGQSG